MKDSIFENFTINVEDIDKVLYVLTKRETNLATNISKDTHFIICVN